MSIDKKILKEIQKYNTINKYISEQFDAEAPETDAAAPTDTALPADGAATTDAGVDAIPEPVDIANDPDVEVVDDTEGDVATDVTSTEPTEEGGTEELDITDLVTSQKDIQSKQDEYMNTMFSKLGDLEEKLSAMDAIFNKINDIENKIEKYREKTPEEKLSLRSLDSYPYNQKLSDFFMDKQDEFEKTGKNEYILTSDEVENFSPNEIKNTFNKFEQDNNNF
jgi:hypothetical protein